MRERLPDYLKRGIVDTEKTRTVRKILLTKGLNTVCDAARCPNKGECYAQKTATFLALGNICTRNCRFCSIKSDIPNAPNPNEPKLIAEASKELGLKYVVVTMVTRDDLIDNGAQHIANITRELKSLDSPPKVEVLISDMQGDLKNLETILDSPIDVLNHNIETVQRLYKTVRPKAIYERSLKILEHSKTYAPHIKTKTGLMLGLGETQEELQKTFEDLKDIKCNILTAGQYMQPTKHHYNVHKYVTPEEFEELEIIAKKTGIKFTAFGPLVRSSYKAKELFFL